MLIFAMNGVEYLIRNQNGQALQDKLHEWDKPFYRWRFFLFLFAASPIDHYKIVY